MGLNLVAAAHRCHVVEGTPKAVLNALATLANENSGWAWPSVEWIAGAVGKCVRQVQRALQELLERGLIELHPEKVPGRGRPNYYRVLLDAWKRVTSLAERRHAAAAGQSAGHRACGKPVDEAGKRVTSCVLKGDMGVTQQERQKKEEKLAPKQPVDKSGPWARGFSPLSGFSATSSCASSAPGAPCRPGGSPMPGSLPFTTPARSTTTSAGSSNSTSSARSGPVVDLVAEFLAERRGKPGW
jgi:hypothetical protein